MTGRGSWFAAVGLTWLTSQLVGWVALRPIAALWSGLSLGAHEFFEPGGLWLLELGRLERGPLLAALGGSLQLFALALLVVVPARAALLATSRVDAPSGEAVVLASLRLTPRLLAHHAFVLVVELLAAAAFVLGAYGVDSKLGGAGLSGELGWLFSLAGILAQGALLFADGWAVLLAGGAGFWRSAGRALGAARSPRLLVARSLKSALGLALGLVGLLVTSERDEPGWLSFALTTALCWALGLAWAALDGLWYRYLSGLELGQTRPPLSGSRPLPDDTTAGAAAPADPTPDPDASSATPA